MANINRDYIVEINCDFDTQYNKKFELMKRDKPMVFYKDDRNSGNFFVLVKGFKPELTLKMGVLYPIGHKRVEIYEPILKGTQEDTYIFEVVLNNTVLSTPGTFTYQFFISDNEGKEIACDIDKLKVKDCL